MLRQSFGRRLALPTSGLVGRRSVRFSAGNRAASKRYFSEKKVEVGEVPVNAKVHKSAPPPPPPSSGGGGGGGMWILLTAALVGGGYYFKDDIYGYLGWNEKSDDKGKDILDKASKDTVNSVKTQVNEAEAKLAKTVEEEKKAESDSKAKPKTAQPTPDKAEVVKQTTEADWKAIREEVVALLDGDYDDGSYGPVLVRLAWHSAGTYNKNTGKGGTEGAAMRFDPEGSWGANKGLHVARNLLEPIKAKHPEITYSDLWSFAGTVAIEEMGGPQMKWRPGRKDYPEGENVLEDGLLPDADGRSFKEKPAEHIREIFGRMGFNDQEAVALIGAHALGRCHTKNSGYDGPWTNAPTTFSNEFFRLLLIENEWKPKQWKGPMQYEDSTKKLMMLPTDFALVQDEKFRKYVELYAKDENKFFNDFAKAWMKLQENGVRKFHGWRRYILFGPRE